MTNEVKQVFYNDEMENSSSIISEFHFFARKCVLLLDDFWDRYFILPGDEHVKMILDTSSTTNLEHLKEAEARIKKARKHAKL